MYIYIGVQGVKVEEENTFYLILFCEDSSSWVVRAKGERGRERLLKEGERVTKRKKKRKKERECVCVCA